LVALLQIQELSVFAFHDDYRNMLHTKSFTELSPLHLVRRASGSETGSLGPGTT
jgi:hypothetical protein